ncbi:MAG: guanine deaminase [Pseudomonadota bacterium]|nr:MAG: guanine deaminase [Pseudomonadota bacterium]
MKTLDSAVRALRGTLVWFHDDPFVNDDAMRVVEDGIVAMAGGRIVASGPASEVLPALPPGVRPMSYGRSLILPGFVDAHIHYVQAQIVGSCGAQLLDWLDRYTFNAEQAFAEVLHSEAIARFFCDELLRHGTTTAVTFCAVYPQSVEAVFGEAERRNMRLIAGKVLMDRNAPAALTDTAQKGYDDSKTLLEKWHGRGRLLYAITPRFAGSSSPEQLEAAGALWREHPDAYLHSHLAENLAEVAWVRQLFPDALDYVDVYERYGLLGPRALYAHGIHLSERELGRLAATGTAIAHCPTSNLFLGSGLFRLHAARKHGIHVALGTDIGAGTSYSLLKTMGDAYKVAQLNGQTLTAAQAYYTATLGAARALRLDDRIGALEPGYEADLVVLDVAATPALQLRTRNADGVEDLLFALMILGDDRAVRATYIAGELAHDRDADAQPRRPEVDAARP